MAATAGRNSIVTYGTGTVSLMNDASFDVDVENAEITAFGDTAVTRVTGLRDASLSVSGSHDKSDTYQSSLIDNFLAGSDCAAMRLRTGAASGYYDCDMVPTKLSVKAKASADPIELSMDFAGDGTPTYSTGAPTVDA